MREGYTLFFGGLDLQALMHIYVLDIGDATMAWVVALGFGILSGCRFSCHRVVFLRLVWAVSAIVHMVFYIEKAERALLIKS